jgi:uncharacterized protein YacL (UPF0231 family)
LAGMIEKRRANKLKQMKNERDNTDIEFYKTQSLAFCILYEL